MKRRKLSKDPMNSTRRSKYAKEPDYRVKVLERTHAFREQQRLEAMDQETPYSRRMRKRFENCNPRHADSFLRYGVLREPHPRGKKPAEPIICFIGAELSGALERHMDAIAQWADKGLIPRPGTPVYTAKGSAIQAYSAGEARRIALAFIQVCKSPGGQLRAPQRKRLKELLSGKS